MTQKGKDKDVAQFAHEVPCSEGTARRLDRLGVINPIRDRWNRRLFGNDDVAAARRHLERKSA